MKKCTHDRYNVYIESEAGFLAELKNEDMKNKKQKNI